MKNSDNIEYFRKRFKRWPTEEFAEMVDRVPASLVAVLAVSEIYNVRIIVYEFNGNTNRDPIKPTLQSYVSCSNIPLILLVTAKQQSGDYDGMWGVVHQQHGEHIHGVLFIDHITMFNCSLNVFCVRYRTLDFSANEVG